MQSLGGKNECPGEQPLHSGPCSCLFHHLVPGHIYECGFYCSSHCLSTPASQPVAAFTVTSVPPSTLVTWALICLCSSTTFTGKPVANTLVQFCLDSSLLQNSLPNVRWLEQRIYIFKVSIMPNCPESTCLSFADIKSHLPSLLSQLVKNINHLFCFPWLPVRLCLVVMCIFLWSAVSCA